jgi:hypothetical protein
MSALSYFSPRFPPMRVVWEVSRHILRAVRRPEGDGGVLPPLVRCRLWRHRLHREDLSAEGLDVPPGDELRAAAVHHV